MRTRPTELFAHRFDAELRRRGREALDAGRVELTAVEPGFALAAVQEPTAEIRDVGLRWSADGSDVSAACTCPAYAKSKACEHLWATILAADERLRAEVAGATDAPESRATTARLDQAWRRRLAELHALVAEARRDPWAPIPTQTRRLVYVVDPRRSEPHGDLYLQLFWQNRLKSGAWGVRRPADLDRTPPESLEDALDRLVIGALEDTLELGRVDDDAPMGREVSLSAAQRELLLERLCRSGRLYLESTGREENEPLRLDEGPPWTPAFDLVSEPERGEVRVEAAFVRDGERLPLDEPAVIFADGWLCARGAFMRFDARGSLDLLLLLRREGPIRAPLDVRAELEASLLEAPGGAHLHGGAPVVVEDAVPRPHLRVFAQREEDSEELGCQISFDYGGVEVRCSDARGLIKKFAVVELRALATPTLIRRDLAAEAARLEEFVAVGGEPEREEVARRDGRISARALPIAVTALLASGWTIDAQGKRYRRAGTMRLAVKSGIDWFDLEGGIDFDGQVASLPALLAAAKKGAGVVTLGDGSIGVLPEDWLSRWSLLEVAGDSKGERVRFKKSQGWMLDALLAERGEAHLDEAFLRWRSRLDSVRSVEPRAEPRSFRGELREYQRDGLGWFAFLRELGFGGCLADDMGLGKTVQVLALLEERRLDRRETKPSIVIAPKSLAFNWRAEAQRFTPELSVLDYSGVDRTRLARKVFEHDLVVTTYGTLRQDAVFFKDVEFDYVILDEAQAIKNAQSQVAKAARLLRADHRLVLTGTPIENHMGELWSLFEFLNPGMLGRSSLFRAAFAGRADSGADSERRELLARSLRPFFLRRTKAQVLRELPEKTEQILWCEFDEQERRAYDELATHFRARLLAPGGGELPGELKFHVLEALLRLRQAACHPGLLDDARRGEESAKLEVLLPLLEEVVESGHKALVFSQFTSLLSILRDRLDATAVKYAYLDGKTRDREQQVERFQSDPECSMFLISLKAGGFGLNLTAADYVFLLDPWWNPAAETQAIDRAHRIGQTRSVTAYRLIARGTVEERVLELQGRKRGLAEAILTEDNALLRDLTREDLERLLT